MLPSLYTLSKPVRQGDFSRIITRIDKCKSKLQEVVEDGGIIQALKSDLVGRLKGFVKILSDVEINLISFCHKVCELGL